MQDFFNNVSIINHKILIDVRNKWPMHNDKYQSEKENIKKTTQINLCNISSELSI